MIHTNWKLLGVAVLLGIAFCTMPTEAEAQRKKNKKGQQEETQKKEKPKAKKGDPKPYAEVITSEATSDEGLFTVHQVDDKYYYEIPDSLFGREMLMVSRIAKTATNIGYGGEKFNEQVLVWEKKGNKVYVRVRSYQNIASDTTKAIYQAVKNSNLDPILAAFDVAALSKDSSGVVIDVTDMFTKDVKALGMPEGRRNQYKANRLDGDRTYIESIKSYPINIEARSVKTYLANNPPSNSDMGSITIEINNSMILLPKEPMMPRHFDQRVGWFTSSQVDYSLDAQKAKRTTYLDRWKLVPKDIEAYKRGELVEPVKPIVYYIDPATPKKWIPYLKQGVEDWQVAFEEAGFKNAIIAKEAPTPEEDPEWSPEDARYSVIRYFASDIQNAYGPHVSDPRSGEIIESDIGWYHNVMNLLRNWFFIQTAAINPKAQSVEFDDEVMGRLIRFVSAHEVGHTLGLPHNMGASVAYPVDSLRSPTFTKTMGTAPSIMDYARFNYVAQPEDGDVALMPQVGIYDKYAIKWGYSYISDATTPEAEKSTLDQWIKEHEGDPLYRFGRQMGNPIDPSSQTEDLGDDSMLASEYGIKNLKRIVPNLVEWTKEDGKNYEDLEEMYGQVLGQWNRYMGHVTANVGGVYEIYKTYDQEGAVYTHAPKEKQQRAVQFLINQAFETPEWMIDRDILGKVEHTGMVERIRRAQERILNNLMDFSRLARMIENEALNGNSAYSILEMMDDLRGGVFTEATRGRDVDTYRRNLQRAYIEGLEKLMMEEQPSVSGRISRFIGYTPIDVSQSDIRAIARGELNQLRTLIRRGASSARNTMTRYHYEDLLVRIDDILNIED